MRSKQFSPLMRGSGPDWSSQFKWYEQPGDMSSCDSASQHSRYVIHDKQLYRTVPKTFATNKGAMMLYTSEDLVLKDRVSQSIHGPPSTAIPTTSSVLAGQPKLDNLQKIILQYGAQEEEKACLKFTRPSYDDVFLDESTRPGALPEVYLEDLKYKTKCYVKSNRNSTPKLQPTERPRSVKSATHRTPTPPTYPTQTYVDHPHPVEMVKRAICRPSSSPPQPMKSVEKRKIEIIRDQLKHISAADKRDKQKYADFEFVSSISDNLRVKGLESKPVKRRAYSSPVYKTKYAETNKWITEESHSQSLPLFVVTATSRGSPHHQDSDYERLEKDEYSDSDSSSDQTNEHRSHDHISEVKHRVRQDAHHDEDTARQDSEYLTDREQEKGDNRTAYTYSNEYRSGNLDNSDEDAVVINMDNFSTDALDSADKITGLSDEEGLGRQTHDPSRTEGQTAAERAEGAQRDKPERCVSSRAVIIDMSDENISEMKVSCTTQDYKKADVVVEDEGTTTTTTMKSELEEMSSIMEGSMQNNIMTYHSLSSVNSRGEITPQQMSEGSITSQSETLSFTKKHSGLKDPKDGKRKARQKQSGKKLRYPPATTPMGPRESDSEFKEKAPPRSLVSIHRDNVDSTVSITKKKLRKKRAAKSSEVPWEKAVYVETSDIDEPVTESPATLLNDFVDDTTPLTTRDTQLQTRQRKKLDRTAARERQIGRDGSREEDKQCTSLDQIKPVLVLDDNTAIKQLKMETEDDEEMRQRSEEREAELRKLEGLTKIVGLEDGSLKRLGQKVEIIEKETIQLKDKEAAQRILEKNVELAKKEEERKAYEEIMRAQEKEYEEHLQKLLLQEEERNKLYLKKLHKEEEERDLKRKWALFRQNQNLELRQHVRLTKLKQKFTCPYRYSYFPLLKINYMKIVNGPEPPNKSKKVSLKQQY